MPFDLVVSPPGATIDALATAVDRAKSGDRLAPVTVVVPTNVSGVMARRALGRTSGVLGVDMLTLNRLAELIAGPVLARQRRRPVSSPVLELTVRAVLDDEPGAFAAVAGHASTVRALREAHDEIRLAGPDAAAALAVSPRGRNVVRVSAAVTRALAASWYDEADLFEVAARELRASTPPEPLRRVVVHLPEPFPGRPLAFVRALAELADVTIVSCLSGDPEVDTAPLAVLDSLGIESDRPRRAGVAPTPARPAGVVSTTDADDEAAVAVRAVVDAARGALTGSPVPFERIGVLWPSHQPYARLVEHHLGAAELPWNGRGGTELSERIAPRLLLDLLDVDRRGLRRRALFELLADVPGRQSDGSWRPTASWERVSRLAGVSGDNDWAPRLAALARNERWTEPAESLAAFVDELRTTLGRRDLRRRWVDWVDWCVAQLDAWLGTGAAARLSDPEYRAWEALMSALERMRCLDEVSDPVDRSGFRSVLEAELDANGVREGRIGNGVTVGSLASASGLDVDVAIVLGGADGLLPPRPRSDPLLTDADRERAGLTRSDDRAQRLRHQLGVLTAGVHTIVTVPRGDLRTTTEHQPSRWLSEVEPRSVTEIASFGDGLARADFAPTERERRLGELLRRVRAAGPGSLSDLADAAPIDDEPLRRRLDLHRARARPELTEFDGDLSGVDVPSPVDRDVSPTQIEQWASCPHGYFVQYLLDVRPVDEPDTQISMTALDRGLVQHDALDHFHRDVIAGRLPQPTTTGWTSEHRAALLAHFDDVCAHYEALGRAGRAATWAGERARMRADLVGWLERDGELCRTRGATVLESEHRFPGDGADDVPTRVTLPLPDGRLLGVKGAVDRLDRTRDGVLVVTDHKTGKDDKFRKLGADDPTLGGTRFQLATYAAAALARDDLGAADDGDLDTVAIRSEYSMFDRGGYKRIGYDASPEIWETIRHDLGEVVAGIEAGWFPQLPERPGFRLWPSCHYCEPDGLGTAEVWRRWERKRHDPRVARWFADGPDDDDHDDRGGERAADVR